MKFLIDFFPILLFFIALQVWDPFVATAVAMVATVAQILYLRFRNGKVEPLHLFTLVVVVVLGGATLLSQNEAFFKWKPTVVYWIMALALLVSQLILGKNLIQKLMGGQIQIPAEKWVVLNHCWEAFFIFLGVLNLWVAFSCEGSNFFAVFQCEKYRFSFKTWGSFKLFGTMGLTLLFALLQGIYLSRHIQETPEAAKPQDSLPK